jgi:very-short-patch-repair endonuclease
VLRETRVVEYMDEYISVNLRVGFREFCVDLYKRQIDDIFINSKVKLGKATQQVPGDRRQKVQDYYSSLDWTKLSDCEKFCNVISTALTQTYIPDEKKTWLRNLCELEGLAVDNSIVKLKKIKGVASTVKNLIFASIDAKPEIVLEDALHNEIRVVKNEDKCLVYDQPILDHGLLWTEMVAWWRTKYPETEGKAEQKLAERLELSLSSPPEKSFFGYYYGEFRNVLGERLPALIPQVYLHYDPYTFKQLQGEKRLFRQRMDFLMLFSNQERVVIEIDGKQHYSEKDVVSPKLYAEMVAEDRRLKLSGYDVYRFGGYELLHEAATKNLVSKFFNQLFKKHSIG